MWNLLDLQCPTTDIVEYRPEDSHEIDSLQKDFVQVLTTAADKLTSDNPLWKEMHVFQNIQTKYKRILRCDKCLIYLHRVSHCLKKMVLLNLSKSFLDLAERFLVGFQNGSVTQHLPSRQQVEYVLVRTQSAAKLVCEAIQYSRDTFCFLIQKLKVGHIILDLVMAASVTARLNIMLKGILVQLSDLYQTVIIWRYKIKEGVHEWSEKMDLPEDLQKWLSVSESELMGPIPLSKSDAEFFSSITKSKNGAAESDADSIIISESQKSDSDCFVVDDDYGEVIPRKEGLMEHQPSLTDVQNKVLRKLISAPSFAKLEGIWQDIQNSDADLLITLSVKKKRIIGKFLIRVQKRLQKHQSKPKKKSLRDPKSSVHIAGVMLAKYLGFTQDQIDVCKSCSDSSSEATNVNLQPVKTLKELKALYEQLSQRLLAVNKAEEHRKLKKIFKRRISDIRLLKRNGEKAFAKKLTLCTSKVILTLCQK